MSPLVVISGFYHDRRCSSFTTLFITHYSLHSSLIIHSSLFIIVTLPKLYNMTWFLAKMVFRIFCGNGNHTPQFEQQLRLIYAEDELHAFHKARLLGDGARVNDEAENAANIKWKFLDVIELHSLTVCTDGAEVYSLIWEENDADTYIRSVRNAATQLLQKSLSQFTGINSILIGT